MMKPLYVFAWTMMSMLLVTGCGHTRYYTLYDKDDLSILTTEPPDGSYYLQAAIVNMIDAQKLTETTLEKIETKPNQEIKLRPGHHVVVVGYVLSNSVESSKSTSTIYRASPYAKIVQFTAKPNVKYLLRAWQQNAPRLSTWSTGRLQPDEKNEPWEKDWFVWIEEIISHEVVAGTRPY